MKYLKAKYKEIMKCPECGWYNYYADDDMPDKYDWRYDTDDNGIDYVECPCGCKFTEK